MSDQTDAQQPHEELDAATVRAIMEMVLRQHEGFKPLAISRKWKGGTLYLRPGDHALQPKEIPIDGFIHKIIMIRERLRVLEQKINNHASLDDCEKLELEQYITRIYGSLTTFNVLFAEEQDRFQGSRRD